MPGPDSPDAGPLGRRAFLGLAGAGLAAAALPRRAAAAGPALHSWLDAAPSGTFTLSNATVVTHTGERLVGAGVRVEGGVIAEVGAAVTGGTDLGGAWVVPGFTDAGCTVGLIEIGLESSSKDETESSDAVTPDARASDAYNPLSEVVPVTRAAGFTHVLVHPTGGLVSGQAGLFRTAGTTVDEVVVARDDIAFPLRINLGHGGLGGGSGAPTSRMGVAMKLRALLDAAELPEDQPEPEPGRRRRRKDESGGKDIPADDTLDPLPLFWRQVRRGEVPVLFHAERADDILLAVQLKLHYGLHAALLGGAEAWLVADRLASAGMGVLLGPPTVQPDSFEHPHARYENPKLLDEAGVPFAFRSGASHFSRTLKTEVGVACAHGLRWEAAIRGLTCGLEDVLGYAPHGRLEAGAPATFFLTAGDPLQPRFGVQRLWIEGREASLDTRQSRLAARYRELW